MADRSDMERVIGEEVDRRLQDRREDVDTALEDLKNEIEEEIRDEMLAKSGIG